jgi:hypothetical protein
MNLDEFLRRIARGTVPKARQRIELPGDGEKAAKRLLPPRPNKKNRMGPAKALRQMRVPK